MSARRTCVVLVLAAAALIITSSSAAAHPLGNFTTNRYARIEPGLTSVRLHYVLDEAELVAFQERAALASGRPAFARARSSEIGASLLVKVNDRPVTLKVVDHRLTEPPGQGGLPTLRLEVLFEADLSPGTSGLVRVEVTDDNQPNRLGWREMIVTPAPGSRLVQSDVPAEDQTDALRSYPADPAAPRLDVRSARFTFEPGGTKAAKTSFGDIASGPGSGDGFVGLVARTTSAPLPIAAALLAALGFGALHAVGPGHGKTVMAAYLVSTRGRRRDALYLGGIVSLMHTASVLALALLLATIGRKLDSSRIFPVLTVVAGVTVLTIGLRLLARRLRNLRAPGSQGHEHADHVHTDHDHQHDVGGAHIHGAAGHTHELSAGVAPLSRAGLVALGTSGGLFPSPSAVVVLVGAFALGRAALGLALIAAFSLGLALVLVGIGLLLVAGRDRLAGLAGSGTLRWLPPAGAAAISILGAVLVVQGMSALS